MKKAEKIKEVEELEEILSKKKEELQAIEDGTYRTKADDIRKSFSEMTNKELLEFLLGFQGIRRCGYCSHKEPPNGERCWGPEYANLKHCTRGIKNYINTRTDNTRIGKPIF